MYVCMNIYMYIYMRLDTDLIDLRARPVAKNMRVSLVHIYVHIYKYLCIYAYMHICMYVYVCKHL